MSVPFPLGKCPMHCHVTGGIKNRPLGGRPREPGLLTRCNRKSARPRRPNSFGSLGLQMRRLSGFAPASIANRRNALCTPSTILASSRRSRRRPPSERRAGPRALRHIRDLWITHRLADANFRKAIKCPRQYAPRYSPIAHITAVLRQHFTQQVMS